MKIQVLLIVFLFFTKSFAQTITVTENNEETGIKERFTVLKSDNKTREGKYELFGLVNSTLICKGFYKNDLKSGLWSYFDWHGRIADSGRYQQGKKIGIWSAYNFKHELTVQYDYTNNKLIFLVPDPKDTGAAYEVINGAETFKAHLERPPVYLDGEGRFATILATQVRYPQNARAKRIQGKVIVAFTINNEGVASNYYVKAPIGYDCDAEALRIVKSIGGDWLPGMLNGKPVTVEYLVPVSFSLQY